MVRTRSDAYNKASVKAPRKQSSIKGDSGSTPKNSKSDYSGGNSYFPRPIPAWQKPITTFFSKSDGNDQCAEKKSVQKPSAATSFNYYESIPSCSKDDPELMDFMDSETISSNEEESNQDDSAMNLESASNNDSKFENAMNLDPVDHGGDSKLEEDAKNSDPVVNERESKLEEDPKNSESVSKADSKLEDVMNSELAPNEEESKRNEDVENLEPGSNENANLLPCGDKWWFCLRMAVNNSDSVRVALNNGESVRVSRSIPINNGNQDNEANSSEVDYQDDDNSNLSESSDINAAAIGVHASPRVNDLDDQDSGCVDE